MRAAAGGKGGRNESHQKDVKIQEKDRDGALREKNFRTENKKYQRIKGIREERK